MPHVARCVNTHDRGARTRPLGPQGQPRGRATHTLMVGFLEDPVALERGQILAGEAAVDQRH